MYSNDFETLNEFYKENYLQSMYYEAGDNFRSSRGENVDNIGIIFYDYDRNYTIEDVADNIYMKNLTLDYDYLGNEYFELIVINYTRSNIISSKLGS